MITTPHGAVAVAERFLRALYGNDAPGYVAVWRYANKQTTWYQATELAAAAKAVAGHGDIYFGMGLHPKDLGSGERGTSEDVSAIPGLWIEIDVKGPAHKQEDLPLSIEDALALLDEFPLPPTIVIHSGHGLHVHWLFRELWTFDDDAERQRAAALVEAFQATIKVKARTHGWSTDSTADLARVLRPPGSVNAKIEPVAVRILSHDDTRRYDPSDFDEWLIVSDVTATPNGTSTVDGGPKLPLGKAALDFVANGVPIGQQRARALAAGRNYLSAGYSVDDTAAALMRGFQASPCDPDRGAWTFADASRIARDLAESPPKPLKPLIAYRVEASQVTPNGHHANTDPGVSLDPMTEARGSSSNGQVLSAAPGALLAPVAPTSRADDERPWPEPPGDVAFAGLAGRFVDALLPHTEADPVALLLSFLIAFAIAVGSGPHCIVGATRHALRLFVVLVGRSAKARKGDSAQATLRVFKDADPDWTDRRVVSGLSSGEGLIWAVRDPIQKSQPVKEKGRTTGFEIVTDDPGEPDKRLLVLESEFARVLAVMSRQGNTLSPVIRQAWDSGDLRVLTKTNAAKATGAHIGILAHITEEELRRELSDTETVNGFANRLLFAMVRRSKLLPEPEPFAGEKAAALARDVSETLIWSRTVGRIDRSPAAKEFWADSYADLSEERPGLFGALTARAEAHCLRLSAIYALLDRSMVVQPEHIVSALELWGYVDRSTSYLFGNATGDPIADTVLAAMRNSEEMTRNQIYDFFGRHETAGRIAHALRSLSTAGLAVSESRPTLGRPVEVWRAT